MRKKKCIVIVDDSEVDRNLMSSVLKKKGFDVIALEKGDRCLEIVEMKKPSAVLLDILMPGIHGKQILHVLRERYNPIELPILMITVKTDPSEVIEALSLGANDYITKPVDFDIALMRIDTHLKISELTQELIRLKEAESLGAIVTTYNHEINNPLSIALGALRGLEKQKENKNHRRLENALWKIADIVKKIGDATKKDKIEYESYAKKTKLLKIK